MTAVAAVVRHTQARGFHTVFTDATPAEFDDGGSGGGLTSGGRLCCFDPGWFA